MKNHDLYNSRLVDEFSFSVDFVKALKDARIIYLKDLLDMTPEKIVSIPNFTYQMLVEYRTFLKDNNLETK